MRSGNEQRWRAWPVCLAVVGGLLLAGCATAPRVAAGRPFAFAYDTLAFTNQLAWEYGPDAKGRWTGHAREPKPDFTLRCFPMARSVKQFFNHARFDPGQPVTEDAAYARLAGQVLDRSPRTVSPADRRVVIPGYAGLREFSAAHGPLLQSLCGGAADSYLQRGHWRMMFPFFGSQQAAQAKRLADRVRAGQPVVLHLLRFPDTGAINHAVVAFAAREVADGLEFDLYDPNTPAAPIVLRWDRAARSFTLARNRYFEGGRLQAYEVYHRWYY